MQFIQKTVIISIESLGLGEAPDAPAYGDTGVNTLSDTADQVKGLNLPNLSRMGLGNVTFTRGLERVRDTIGFFGKSRQRSDGKDNLAGHWEIAGVDMESLFYTNPKHFFPEIIDKLERITHKQFITFEGKSNYNMINRLGEDHRNTGSIIIYYENDMTIVLASHEDVIENEEFVRYCHTAREICDHYGVTRIKGLRFKGTQPGKFIVTGDPTPYTMTPPRSTLLYAFQKAHIPVYFIGAGEDLFPNDEITESYHFRQDANALHKIIEVMKDPHKSVNEQALIYVALGEIDKEYGHKRDPSGYAAALEKFDQFLPLLFRAMNTADMLIITSSHGNSPCHEGNEHTREYLPILVYSRILNVRTQGNLGVRRTTSDIAETLSEIYSLDTHYGAESFWSYMISQI